ncbi:hypothetical protein N8093_01665 [Planktomarina temperata]|nr:hypothetical protein [Planktomarina temperata]
MIKNIPMVKLLVWYAFLRYKYFFGQSLFSQVLNASIFLLLCVLKTLVFNDGGKQPFDFFHYVIVGFYAWSVMQFSLVSVVRKSYASPLDNSQRFLKKREQFCVDFLIVFFHSIKLATIMSFVLSVFDKTNVHIYINLFVWSLLATPFIFFITQALAYFSLYVPVLQHFYSTIMTLLLFSTPIMWIEINNKFINSINILNPLFYIIRLLRWMSNSVY